MKTYFNMTPVSKCDFCGAALTEGMLYETHHHTYIPDIDKKIVVEVGPKDGFEEWVACDECNDIIINDKEDWTPILDRLVINDKLDIKSEYMQRQLRRVAGAMHAHFRLNRTSTPPRVWYSKGRSDG
jgi:hypothetical protein